MTIRRPPSKPCATCRHYVPDKEDPVWWIGTCKTGGPRQDGCSDVAPDESCERHEEDPDRDE